jgi:mannose/fructose/N-acetylgalactosamine-specific phosphotransferase system component IID
MKAAPTAPLRRLLRRCAAFILHSVLMTPFSTGFGPTSGSGPNVFAAVGHYQPVSPRFAVYLFLQGSVFGPILFIMYAAGLLHLIARHNLGAHQYADDTQV